MVLAEIAVGSSAPPVTPVPAGQAAPIYKPLPAAFLATYESRVPDYTVRFNESSQGSYYITAASTHRQIVL
jgi:hypothetical protein